jgi:uncharacterized Zn finger protein (UPF0148 family)
MNCPRCQTPLTFDEGWAYCETCSGLFCTDEEAAAALAHLARLARAEYDGTRASGPTPK